MQKLQKILPAPAIRSPFSFECAQPVRNLALAPPPYEPESTSTVMICRIGAHKSHTRIETYILLGIQQIILAKERKVYSPNRRNSLARGKNRETGGVRLA